MATKKKEVVEKEIIVVTQADIKEAMESNPEMKWFIIQTYSGKDNAAKRSIEERLITSGTGKDVGIIVMAEKKVEELRNGKMKVVKKRLYPSYLYFLAKPVSPDSPFMDEAVYSAIQGSANLHGFIGQDNAKLPKSIVNKIEMNRMISQLQDGDNIEVNYAYSVGTEVTITTGGFEGMSGRVSDINYPKNTVRVEMQMLGTITPVELTIDNIMLASKDD